MPQSEAQKETVVVVVDGRTGAGSGPVTDAMEFETMGKSEESPHLRPFLFRRCPSPRLRNTSG